MKANHLPLIACSIIALFGVSTTDGRADSQPDVSTLPIAADEPIEPKGFPPLPARLDLPIAKATASDAFAPAAVPAKLYGGGYKHAPTIIPSKDPFTGPEPARPRIESPPKIDAPLRIQRLPAQETPAIDAPQSVIIDQAHSQDLTMPDDANQNADSRNQSNSQSNITNKVKNQLLQPIRRLRGRALGI
jgi:hypothetical protein